MNLNYISKELNDFFINLKNNRIYLYPVDDLIYNNLIKSINNKTSEIVVDDIIYEMYILLDTNYVNKDEFNLSKLLKSILDTADTKKLLDLLKNNCENIIIVKHIIVYLTRLLQFYNHINENDNNTIHIIYYLYVIRDDLMLYIYNIGNASYCEKIMDAWYFKFDDEIANVILKTYIYHCKL